MTTIRIGETCKVRLPSGKGYEQGVCLKMNPKTAVITASGTKRTVPHSHLWKIKSKNVVGKAFLQPSVLFDYLPSLFGLVDLGAFSPQIPLLLSGHRPGLGSLL